MAALAALVLPACRASVNVNAKASADDQSEDATQEPTEAESAPAAPLAPPPVAQSTAYFGVARSLTLKPGGRQPACACVDAVVGSAGDPAFDWHGTAPAVGPDALVVAIGSEGMPCETQGRGPSIAAIDRSGNDVVIVLEEFNQTRPLALGAIIPNPGADGHVYLRARGKSPYGRPLAGSAGTRGGLCPIGTGTGTSTAPPPADDSSSSVEPGEPLQNTAALLGSRQGHRGASAP